MALITLYILILIGLGWGDHFRFVSPEEIQVRIFEKIFRDMFKKEKVYVFLESENTAKVRDMFLTYSEVIVPVGECKRADIVLITGRSLKRLSKDCREKIAFSLYREDAIRVDTCVGSFYWRKGRPNVILIKEKLEKFKINLPAEYEKFIESIKDLMVLKTEH